MSAAQNSINELFALVGRRGEKAAQLSRYQGIIDKPMLELSDAELFESVALASKEYTDAKTAVKQKSEESFKALPAGLQFAVKDLGKPLFVGSTQLMNNRISYYLVAKQSTDESGKHIKDEFTYDVEAR